jgi:hypothetical protein
MSDHPLDARLHNLECHELRCALTLLRSKAGLRGKYLSARGWGVEEPRAAEISAMVDELVFALNCAAQTRAQLNCEWRVPF